MKNPRDYIRTSLSRRLSIIIVMMATVFFLGSLGFLFVESRKAVRNEALNGAAQVLDNTVQRVNVLMQRVEIASDNFMWLPLRHLDVADSMFVYSRRILTCNPDLNGCSIAFEPDFFPDKGHYFSAYTYNDDGKFDTTQEGNPSYDYHYMDWYQAPKLLNEPVWVEPFVDFNPEDIYAEEIIASYCRPMKDSKGHYVGTFSTDISMEWISQTISAVKPYPNSYCIMIGQSGTFSVGKP